MLIVRSSAVSFSKCCNIISLDKRRIVAKVDQLMSLCNELEAGLVRSQGTARG
ncbi:MAG TPA: hypothetical protein VIO58_07510 [Candidatus Methanoperedens sp.]